MQFKIKKCRVVFYGIRLPDEQHMKDIDQTGYTYLGIVETDKIKEREMKEGLAKSICDG